MFVTLLVVGSAQAADDLNFAPDRPGVGDSSSTPGRGRFLAQFGVLGTLGGGTTAVTTSGWMLRMGIDEGVELRVRAPDVGVADGVGLVGTVGLGAMVGGSVGERWSVSVVPEVFVDPGTGDVGGQLNANVAVAVGAVGVWAHGSASGVTGGTTWLAGGGVSWFGGGVGVFVNAYAADAPYVGGGAWWVASERLQIDVGVDVGLPAEGALVVPTAGVSAGF